MLSHVQRVALRAFSASANSLQKTATAAATAAATNLARIQSVRQNAEDRSIEVEWNDGTKGEFSYIWLRDNAPGTRRKYLHELNLEVKPETLTLSDSGEEVIIQWPPYTLNTYSAEFLRKYMQAETEEVPLAEDTNGTHVKWGRNNVKLATPTWQEFLTDPTETVEHFEKYGIVCVTNCGLDLKPDNSSPVADTVLKKLVPENAMRTEVSLHNVKERADSMHTYGPQHREAPHYVAMLFLEQADSQFQLADGFKIGYTLKHKYQELYDVLENVKINYNDLDGNYRAQHPVFVTDPNGKEVSQVLFNNSQRSIQGNLSTVEAEVFYKALKAFHRECYKPDNVIQKQIARGELLVFNNRRILYGHSAFTRPCNVLVTCYT